MKNDALLLVLCILFLSAGCKQEKQTNIDIDPFTIKNETPTIVHIGMVSDQILGLTIKEQYLKKAQLSDYMKGDNDSIVYIYSKDGILQKRVLYRNGKKTGFIAGEKENKLHIFESIKGDTLTTDDLSNKDLYQISSTEDRKYEEKTHPVDVYQKSKVLTWANPGKEYCMLHTIYLKLPATLKTNKKYTISFKNIGLSGHSVQYYHTPSLTRSEAIHINHSGFHPDDPVKRAYLSIWLGTGKGFSYDQRPEFTIIDTKSKKEVYKGQAEKALSIHETEMLKERKNYSNTEVWHLNFKDLNREGEYRVVVDNIGCSFPFNISENVWSNNFKHTMKGYLSHRSGIALDSSLTGHFTRPRCFHPQDGVTIYKTNFAITDLWSGRNASQKGVFKGLIKNKTEKTASDAWGGYMDAGDWDRRIQHLSASRKLLELFEMHPDFYENTELELPDTEKYNNIPDILDEVQWNIDCYRRMQTSNGGISYGIESSAHPVNGEPSWLESLDIFQFSNDVWSSFEYAATAAKLAYNLKNYAPDHAKLYGASAEQAYQFAHENFSTLQNSRIGQNRVTKLNNIKTLALIELYKWTGNSVYLNRFESMINDQLNRKVDANLPLTIIDATFSYQMTQSDDINTSIKKATKSFILNRADRMLSMVKSNAYNLTNRIPDIPILNGYYSAGNNIELCRAHYLSNEKKYLEGALLSVMYTAGANPMNMTMTTGLGHRSPNRPLHLDSQYSGQKAPEGITVYAQADHLYFKNQTEEENLGKSWATWAIYWIGQQARIPGPWEWPPHEGYIDYSKFPSMNEYTIHQTFGPISYAYGYLASRPN